MAEAARVPLNLLLDLGNWQWARNSAHSVPAAIDAPLENRHAISRTLGWHEPVLFPQPIDPDAILIERSALGRLCRIEQILNREVGKRELLE